ncbi:hypothetical protein [Cyanobium sp. Morenito 9A2]|uniref:hypothetical protein n=1 Tax=Cyanobium sp. Morenito 9A2 TaxID=2823718 RepID=UPI0020CDA74D|nr:hypothetical protein [Cyanobium sp. Morenito 9A2]MCP9848846.1 hypothetical protein [Cyanobium sp. Morenito 9A2]
MLLPSPFVPLAAAALMAKIAGLQATVLLLLTLLLKARIQIKAASALGLTLLALQTLVFLVAGGTLALGSLAAGGVALSRRPAPTR